MRGRDPSLSPLWKQRYAAYFVLWNPILFSHLERMSFVGLLDGSYGFLEADVGESDDEDNEGGIGDDRNDGEVGKGDEESERDGQSDGGTNRLTPINQIYRRRRNVAKEPGQRRRDGENKPTDTPA